MCFLEIALLGWVRCFTVDLKCNQGVYAKTICALYILNYRVSRKKKRNHNYIYVYRRNPALVLGCYWLLHVQRID